MDHLKQSNIPRTVRPDSMHPRVVIVKMEPEFSKRCTEKEQAATDTTCRIRNSD